MRCLGMGDGTSETLPPFDSNNWGSILTGSGGSGSELVEPVLGGFFRFTGIGSISLVFIVLGSGAWRRGRGGKRREEVGRTLGKGLGGDERYTKLYTKLYTKSKRQKRLYKWYYTVNLLSHHQAVCQTSLEHQVAYLYLFIVVVKGHIHICPKKREGRKKRPCRVGKW